MYSKEKGAADFDQDIEQRWLSIAAVFGVDFLRPMLTKPIKQRLGAIQVVKLPDVFKFEWASVSLLQQGRDPREEETR